MLERLGSERSRDECEAILNILWKPDLARQEAALYDSKWYDCRDLHPVQATEWFGFEFTKAVRQTIRAHINPAPPVVRANGKVSDWNPIKDGDIFEQRPGLSPMKVNSWRSKINSLIRARQNADAIGCPYGIYAREAVRRIYFGRDYLLQFTELAVPKHMVGAEMQDHLLMYWADILESKIQHAEHPRFLVSSGSNHPDVISHRSFLLDQINRRSVKKFSAQTLVNKGLLTVEEVHQRFGKII